MGYETGQVITGRDIAITSSGFEVSEMSGEERSERLGRIGVDWLGLAAGTKGAQKVLSKGVTAAKETPLLSDILNRVKVFEPEFLAKYKNKAKQKRIARSKRAQSELGNHVRRTADEVNAQDFPDQLKKGTAPYKSGTEVIEYITTADDAYVRVWRSWTEIDEFGNVLPKNNEARSWLMRIEDVIDSQGNLLSGVEIKAKFAIPDEVPMHISRVNVPAGTKIRKGIINPIESFGSDGSTPIQYELLEHLPEDFFVKLADLL